MSSFPRDLLCSLPPLHRLSQKPGDEAGEGIELSLGLSLNGRFGVDPARNLSRSSSIPEFAVPPMSSEMELSSPLVRACSLPTETEEECRKRKEVQSLRRLEAKRKRNQKQRTCPAGDRDRPPLQQQGSVGSQGSGTGSSGVSSESDLQQQFHVAESEPKSAAPPSSSIQSNSPGLGSKSKGGALEEMPFVFTKGNGPDGKRVEGFLYRYGKGEEVRIVCVCHGSFLSPAEFVKHAGGGDVAHPMRHIVVLPSSLL